MGKTLSISSLILLCATLIQAAVLSNITALPAVPDLVMLCVLYFSLQNGKLIGESTGFISGLFMDFVSSGPFGINCIVRTLIGYTCGCFNKTLNPDGFFIPLLLGFSGTLIKALLLFGLSFLFPVNILAYNPFTWLFVFELAINTILAPFVFKFLSLFRKSIVLNPEHAL